MSIPRELTLRRIDGQLRLCQKPVRELQQLRSKKLELSDRPIANNSLPLDIASQQLEIILEFQPGTALEFGIRVLKGENQQTVIGYDVQKQSLFIDRTRSGNVKFHPAFSGRHAGKLKPDGKKTVRLQILVDACSIEAFGNDGESVITDLVFPDAESKGVELFSSGGDCRLLSCEIYELKSVWKPMSVPK